MHLTLTTSWSQTPIDHTISKDVNGDMNFLWRKYQSQRYHKSQPKPSHYHKQSWHSEQLIKRRSSETTFQFFETNFFFCNRMSSKRPSKQNKTKQNEWHLATVFLFFEADTISNQYSRALPSAADADATWNKVTKWKIRGPIIQIITMSTPSKIIHPQKETLYYSHKRYCSSFQRMPTTSETYVARVLYRSIFSDMRANISTSLHPHQSQQKFHLSRLLIMTSMLHPLLQYYKRQRKALTQSGNTKRQRKAATQSGNARQIKQTNDPV